MIGMNAAEKTGEWEWIFSLYLLTGEAHLLVLFGWCKFCILAWIQIVQDIGHWFSVFVKLKPSPLHNFSKFRATQLRTTAVLAQLISVFLNYGIAIATAKCCLVHLIHSQIKLQLWKERVLWPALGLSDKSSALCLSLFWPDPACPS